MVLRSLILASLLWSPVLQTSIEDGQRLLQQRDYRGALAVFEQLIVSDPAAAEPYFYAGLALAETGRISEAIAKLQKAVELSPTRPEFVLTYSEILQRAGKQSVALEALRLFEDSEFLDQLDGQELWLLADLFYRFERFDRSREILNQIQPRGEQVEFRLAQIDLKGSQFERAIERFWKLTMVPSLKASAHYSIGLAHFFQNRFEEAREAILEALALDPVHPDYLYQLGVVLIELGQPAQVVEYLSRLEGRHEEFPRICYVLGQAHRRLGNREQANAYFAAFQRGIKKREEAKAETNQIQNLLEEALRQLRGGDVGQARSLFFRVLELDPHDRTAHTYLIRIYISSGLWDRAYNHLQAFQRIDPDSFDLHHLMASYWYERGDREKALEYAHKAKTERPGHADVRNLLGNIYLALGQRSSALREYEAALLLQPERRDFQLNYEAAKKRPE